MPQINILMKFFLLLVVVFCMAAIALAQPIVIEAESFSPVKNAPGWKSGKWGENLYASTFANTFLSRKGFLGAGENADNAIATTEIEVPQAGEYLALARYEAAPRFQTQFTLRIEQKGKVWERRYGARENLKIWAFGEKLKAEVSWGWGAVENVVWEGHDAKVDLLAGRAKLSLIAAAQPAPQARRNVDLVMLTMDKADIENRIANENYLPLDGLLNQSGDLSARVINRSTQPLTITIPAGREHSPYWVHLRTWQPKIIEVAPNAASEWIEVGSLLDTLNDGQWQWKAKGDALNFEVEFDFPTNARKSVLRFSDLRGDVIFAYDADTRSTRRVRLQDDVLYDLVGELKKQKVFGKAPQKTLIYGYTFDPKPSDAKYSAAVSEFIQLTGATALADGSLEKNAPRTNSGLRRGYLELGGSSAAQLAELGQKMQAEGKADDIAVISLGDEIGLPAPPADSHAAFRAWLQEQKIPLETFGIATWNAVEYSPAADAAKQPALFYYSKLYAHQYGIAQIKTLTNTLRKYFPNAGVGANFSPHHGASYLGESHKWARLFRDGGMTMPWSEDYVWGVPIGSPQMSFFNVDLFRAGIKNKPNAKIQMYVMPHDPGNTPAMWRRMFYGAMMHGTKIFNLFEFRPVQAAYTENYVNNPATYREVRRALHELGTFENFVQDGQVLQAQTALWHGETGDIWDDNRAPFGAAKRALYLMLRHQQLPLDIVTQSDDLKDYRALYLSDRHVSQKDSQVISDWVRGGGVLQATAGAGMMDEFNRPNQILRALLGASEQKLEEATAPIRWIKQDLPTASKLDDVKWSGSTLPALGAVSRIESKAKVLASFADGSPALTQNIAGKGRAIYCAFLPGLAYFKPAIPNRPLDRGSTDDAFAHFIPTNFDASAARIVALATENIARPVVCSDALVESTVIQSIHGVLIPLDNWRGQKIKNLRVEISGVSNFKKCRTASGTGVLQTRVQNKTVVTLDLDVADALIFE